MNSTADPPPARFRPHTCAASEDRRPGESATDYTEMRRFLLRTVRLVCPAWIAGSREDIVQAALLRIMKATKKKRRKVPVPASYLWRTAYTATLDEIRSVRRRQETQLNPDHFKDRFSAATPGPAVRSETHELGRAIQRCWRHLLPDRRTVTGLYLLGHGPSEIEDLLGWKVQRVSNLLHRGLRDLRLCLKRKGIRP